MAGHRVFVTGGGGFLGRSVVSSLAADQGVELVVSGDLSVPPESARLDRVVYEHADVTDADLISDRIGTHRVDTVVHLASIVNPGEKTTPEIEFEVDVRGSENVFAACLEHGVGRVVVSSSGAAYGYHADSPAWITEEAPVRGTETFPYSLHKRLVEDRLAELRETSPELEQVVLRIGTILGEDVDNQITALFEKPRILKVRGSDSPFVFIWDEDVVAVIVRAVLGGPVGIYNVAGDGAMTVDEIAAEMGKSTIAVPAGLLRTGLLVANRLGLSPHGPDQIDFLRYRPVLDNSRLKETFGYSPTRTSREAFRAWLDTRTRRSTDRP